MNISRTRFERDIGIEGDGACVYSAARVMDRSTPMNVESGFSISLWTLNTVEVVWRVPGRTRQPQGLPGSLLNSRESPHEFPCQTSEGRGHSRARELLTSLACCKIPSTSGPLDFFLSFFFFVNSNRLSLFYRRRENIKAVIFYEIFIQAHTS